jgi:hypothetical protein
LDTKTTAKARKVMRATKSRRPVYFQNEGGFKWQCIGGAPLPSIAGATPPAEMRTDPSILQEREPIPETHFMDA